MAHIVNHSKKNYLNIKLAMEVAQKFEGTEVNALGLAGTSASANGSVHSVKTSGPVSMLNGNVELLALVTDAVMMVTTRVMFIVLLVIKIMKSLVDRNVLQSAIEPSQPRRG